MEPHLERRLFDWSPMVREAVREHVYRAFSRLDPDRFVQEPAYVAALVARLDGVVYDDRDARVEFLGTVVSDRGRGSAEARWGADFALTATLVQNGSKSKKAVLGQAKRGSIDRLRQAEQERLDGQCGKMRRVTTAALVLDVPVNFGQIPTVRLLEGDDIGLPLNIAEYLADVFMVCRHGDIRGDFVRSAMTSRLTGLHIMASDDSGWPV